MGVGQNKDEELKEQIDAHDDQHDVKIATYTEVEDEPWNTCKYQVAKYRHAEIVKHQNSVDQSPKIHLLADPQLTSSSGQCQEVWHKWVLWKSGSFKI